MAAKKRHQNQTSENDHSSGHKSRSKTPRRRERHTGNGDGIDTKESEWKTSHWTLLIGLALLVSYLHGQHISGMFESDRHFSHLSTLERELAFRTEMGLYYSYFKTIIEAPSFYGGVYEIMNDNITEYPSTINTLKRFNLYPEVVVGAMFRLYEGLATWRTKTCWTVNRGQGLEPVQSCEGLGEPAYFYVDMVFILNGLMMGIFLLFGTYLSGSIWGGIFAVASFFYNHGEGTRVQWTPPLRESFAYPFLVIQMFLVTHVLKIDRPTFKHSIMIAAATICFMLPWQFAQFALMTQTVAVFGCYVLEFIGSHKMRIVLWGQTIGLAVSYVFLFGNEMLLTSFFASCLITVHVIVLLEPVIEKIRIRFFIWAVQGVLLLFGMVGIKNLAAKILQVADDAHIGDILRSKFGNFANFHTMLYTCAAEFDFMEAETPWRVAKTFLSPCVVLAVSGAVVCIFENDVARILSKFSSKKEKEEDSSDESSDKAAEEDDIALRSKPHAEILYHLFQLCAYTVMAVIIMRLKLFWTPHMCLVTSLLASRKIFNFSWLEKPTHTAILIAFLAMMSVGGVSNLMHQRSIMGEFSNWPQEQMVEWIKANTPPDAVFAGPMPTMATVKLCTKRPIVNHPHYEDSGLRARTKKVYSMYSRKPIPEVKQNLIDLKVDYAVLEDSWCFRRSKPGCTMPEIWDIEDEANRGKAPTCELLRNNPKPHFKLVFKNDVYQVLKVTK